ncbi:hypothetical protein M9979_13880 [Sphingomonas sp. RP10(2022)]|uniref:Uncharacterized protein n=1 Tax=Sphingomonas liriopis TaxID=2949094 RepID=A0A9X2KUG6_9SPHN|nr:hypothetical protein [Sphingomonas liriopis]MCP3735958.1 hypothetical protein [Sphingomonas liriopis]
MDDTTATTELHALLQTALELADRLGLTMVGIHIDEAKNLLVEQGTTTAH